MVERYTSPETSRALAEAGLERRIRSYGAYYVENELRRTQFELSVGPSFFAVRALDLTDCIHELTREREGGPLVDGWRMYGHGSVIEVPFLKHNEKHWRTITDASPVEAAALVLLALLKERK